VSITFTLNCVHLNLLDRNDIALTFWHSGSVRTISSAARILPPGELRLSRIDRDGRHETCTSAALEIFGREASLVRYGRVEYFMVTKFSNRTVLEYPSSVLLISTWVLTKMKKVPERGLLFRNFHAKNLFDVLYWFFVSHLRFHGCFFSLPQPSWQKNAVMYMRKRERVCDCFWNMFLMDNGYVPRSRYDDGNREDKLITLLYLAL